MGIIPEGTYANREYLEHQVSLLPSVTEALADVMYDPQTSGGLFFAVPEKEAKELLKHLQSVLPESAIVGQIRDFNGSYVHVY